MLSLLVSVSDSQCDDMKRSWVVVLSYMCMCKLEAGEGTSITAHHFTALACLSFVQSGVEKRSCSFGSGCGSRHAMRCAGVFGLEGNGMRSTCRSVPTLVAHNF